MQRREKRHLQHRIDKFCSLSCLIDIANLLKIKPRSLSYILYFVHDNRDELYRQVILKKKNGGDRHIDIPSPQLKKIQSRLNEYLQDVYWEKKSVHGFLRDRSIITNASPHKRKKNILNIDLKDFFPSIHFGRVFGLFKKAPYNLPPEAAKVLAQIACNERHLVQGSPCSPIISNMICSKLDRDLEKFASKYKIFYTRYADDITFSTNMNSFPKDVCTVAGVNSVSLSDELNSIITQNGFEINNDKLRHYDRASRQEVTGLVVNQFVNVPRTFIRNTRSMLHKWETNGIENASKEYIDKYKKFNSKTSSVNFYKALLGKLNFIYDVRKSVVNKPFFDEQKRRAQGKQDITEKLYFKFYYQYIKDLPEIAIITEGKTDWMHLKAAYQAKSFPKKYNFSLNFFELINKHLPSGEADLMGLANKIKKNDLPDFPRLTIILLDHDNPNYIKTHGESGIKQWSTNLFSMVLPKECCPQYEHFSIEFLYSKTVRKKKNAKGRQLFFTDEFDGQGIHKEKKKLKYIGYDGEKIDAKIIEGRVVATGKERGFNYAVTKNDFAKQILNKTGKFSLVSFSHFSPIFKKIDAIYKRYKKSKKSQ